MGIEDIQISEELQTNAPSIKYSGNEGPKSPQQMQEMMMAQLEEEYLKYVDDMMEQGMEPMTLEQFLDQVMAEGQMSGGTPLPNDPTKPVNPFQPKPTGPVLPDRQMAAYGGIMGMDGRRQYGIGSWIQKAKDIGEQYFTGKTAIEIENESQARVDREQGIIREGSTKAGEYPVGFDPATDKLEKITRIEEGTGPVEGYFDTLFKGEKDDKGVRQGGLNKQIVPIVGGALAGLFTKGTDPDNPGLPSDTTAMALDDLKKSANVLDQQAGIAAGLNFLPAVEARKYTPAQMLETYQNAANGGRIGFSEGTNLRNRMSALMNKMANGTITPEEMVELRNMESASMFSTAKGMAEGGIMDLGGMEKDYRAEGGFVPIGREEKADDVPARLSVNEFVFTADAVRNAGGGDINQGAQVMENMMKHLEQGGQVSKESQGMAGARDMFATSQRLSEVI
jgi:hypothetical protein